MPRWLDGWVLPTRQSGCEDACCVSLSVLLLLITVRSRTDAPESERWAEATRLRRGG